LEGIILGDVQQKPLLSLASVFVICLTVAVVGAAFALSSWHPFGGWTKIDITTVTSSTVQEMKRVSQLIVLKGRIAVSKHLKSTEKSAWIINMGTTEMALLVPNNGFQYIVKLDGLTDEAFQHDTSAKRWVLRVPKPVLDTEMIACESDPSKMEIVTSVGWARLDSYSGQALRDAAKKEIRESVIDQAQQPWVQEAAAEAARGALGAFVSKVIRKLPEDETLSIEFTEDTSKDKPVLR
jgi:hypothetical protein